MSERDAVDFVRTAYSDEVLQQTVGTLEPSDWGALSEVAERAGFVFSAEEFQRVLQLGNQGALPPHLLEEATGGQLPHPQALAQAAPAFRALGRFQDAFGWR